MDKNKEQAKLKLTKFLKNRELTFLIKTYSNDEWVAECNEIPAIITCGIGNDITKRDSMIRDAILTAAGVNVDYANSILKFIGYKVKTHIFGKMFSDTNNTKASYALSA